MIVDSNSLLKTRAEFISNNTITNRLKRSYFTCQMSFKYFMTGNPSSNDIAYLGVSLFNMNSNPLWRMIVKSTSAWTQTQVTIGENVSYFIAGS